MAAEKRRRCKAILRQGGKPCKNKAEPENPSAADLQEARSLILDELPDFQTDPRFSQSLELAWQGCTQRLLWSVGARLNRVGYSLLFQRVHRSIKIK